MESFTLSSPASKSIRSNWNCTIVCVLNGFLYNNKTSTISLLSCWLNFVFCLLLLLFFVVVVVVVVAISNFKHVSMAQETVEGDNGSGDEMAFYVA